MIDVSKLTRPKEVTVELEIEGRIFMSVLEVSEESTPEDIELAKENLKKLITEQVRKAKKKRSKWLLARRWVLDFFALFSGGKK